MSSHDTNTAAIQHIPQSYSAVARPSCYIVAVRMEQHTLQKETCISATTGYAHIFLYPVYISLFYILTWLVKKQISRHPPVCLSRKCTYIYPKPQCVIQDWWKNLHSMSHLPVWYEHSYNFCGSKISKITGWCNYLSRLWVVWWLASVTNTMRTACLGFRLCHRHPVLSLNVLSVYRTGRFAMI